MPFDDTAILQAMDTDAPRRPFRAFSILYRILPGFVLLAWIGLWELLSRLGFLNPFFFPAPSKIASAAVELATVGYPDGILIYVHILATFMRVLSGFLIGSAIAIPAGILVGSLPILDRVFSNIITFGRSIAAISLLPLFIAWFGIGEASKIALISLAVFWVVITYTIAGVKFVDPTLIKAAQSMDTSALTTFRSVILPAALPRIFAGLKLGLAVAFIVIVAAEMIATVNGLGAMIQDARTSFRTDITMLGMLIIGALGYTASLLLDLFGRHIMPWQRSQRERL